MCSGLLDASPQSMGLNTSFIMLRYHCQVAIATGEREMVVHEKKLKGSLKYIGMSTDAKQKLSSSVGMSRLRYHYLGHLVEGHRPGPDVIVVQTVTNPNFCCQEPLCQLGQN